MRILTWNIRNGGGSDRAGSIVGALAQHRPDFIALTEVTGTNLDALRRSLRDQGFDHIGTTYAGGRTSSVLVAAKLPFTVIDPPALHDPERWLFR